MRMPSGNATSGSVTIRGFYPAIAKANAVRTGRRAYSTDVEFVQRRQGSHSQIAMRRGRRAAPAAHPRPDGCGHRLDVTDGAAVEAFVAETEAKLGPVDRLAHVVGIQRFGAIAELSEADFDATFNVNVRGTFLVAKAVAR